jgi:hypothetical protein
MSYDIADPQSAVVYEIDGQLFWSDLGHEENYRLNTHPNDFYCAVQEWISNGNFGEDINSFHQEGRGASICLRSIVRTKETEKLFFGAPTPKETAAVVTVSAPISTPVPTSSGASSWQSSAVPPATTNKQDRVGSRKEQYNAKSSAAASESSDDEPLPDINLSGNGTASACEDSQEYGNQESERTAEISDEDSIHFDAKASTSTSSATKGYKRRNIVYCGDPNFDEDNFIHEVEKRPILWNFKLPVKSRGPRQKQMAWMELVENMPKKRGRLLQK